MKAIQAAAAFLILLSLSAATFAKDANPDADLYRQSYAAEAKGDYDEALALMEKVSASGGGYVLHLRKAWLLYLNGRHADSVAEYRKAAGAEPAAIEPLLGLMLPLMAERKWKQTIEAGLDVLKKAPGDFTAISRIAYARYQQGRFAEAEKWYRKALAGYPSNVEMRAGLGWCLLRLNRFDEAKREFRAVLSIAPDHTSSQEGLSNIP